MEPAPAALAPTAAGSPDGRIVAASARLEGAVTDGLCDREDALAALAARLAAIGRALALPHPPTPECDR